jgi:hypothetical protein
MQYCSSSSIPASNAAQLIEAIYLWTYTSNIREALDRFNTLRQNSGSTWFVERIGLCESNRQLRRFNISIRRNPAGQFTAQVERELGSTKTDLIGRYGIHISDYVLNALLKGKRASETSVIKTPVVIWFNAQGPTLGLISDSTQEGDVR